MTDGPTTPTPGGMPGAPASLVDRAKNILLSPNTEWRRVAAEQTSVGQMFTGYAMILAAIPLVASIIGQLAFTQTVMGVTYRPPMGLIISMAVVGYLIQLGVVYLMGLIIGALSPGFGGSNDKLGGFKISIYATTPVWVLGILSIFPPLAPLVFLAYLYVIYLIYAGVGPVLGVPEDKSVVATLVIVAAYIVLVIVLAVVVTAVVMGILASIFMTSAAMAL